MGSPYPEIRCDLLPFAQVLTRAGRAACHSVALVYACRRHTGQIMVPPGIADPSPIVDGYYGHIRRSAQQPPSVRGWSGLKVSPQRVQPSTLILAITPRCSTREFALQILFGALR